MTHAQCEFLHLSKEVIALRPEFWIHWLVCVAYECLAKDDFQADLTQFLSIGPWISKYLQPGVCTTTAGAEVLGACQAGDVGAAKR